MKALTLLITIVFASTTLASEIQKICYDSLYSENQVRLMLRFDTDKKIITELLHINEDSGVSTELSECHGIRYAEKGEILDYGRGKFTVDCGPRGLKTRVTYINDYDEQLFSIKTSRTTIDSEIEWMCE